MEPTTEHHLLIAETSGLISLVATSDTNHPPALRSLAGLKDTPCTIIVPGDIFTETINTLNKRVAYALAADTAAYLLHTPPFLLTETTPVIRQAATERFHAHGNGSRSLAERCLRRLSTV